MWAATQPGPDPCGPAPTEIEPCSKPGLGRAHEAPGVPRVPLTALVLAAAALPGCAVEQAEGHDPTPTAPAAVRADTLAGVARRIYDQEAGGAVGHAAVKRIARDRALLAALGSGNEAALRAAALRQLFNPGKHVVRLSVVRGGRTLTDVGGAFVVAPARLPLRGAVLEASMQDVDRLREARAPAHRRADRGARRPRARRELAGRRRTGGTAGLGRA